MTYKPSSASTKGLASTTEAARMALAATAIVPRRSRFDNTPLAFCFIAVYFQPNRIGSA